MFPGDMIGAYHTKIMKEDTVDISYCSNPRITLNSCPFSVPPWNVIESLLL